MKKLVNEFKQFVARGNVIDMAVGIIMGTAFTGIVNSLVKDVFMPAVGYLIGGINFTDFKLVISPAAGDTPEVAVLYGGFIQQIINFLLIALVVFMIVKVLNRLQRKKEETPAEQPAPPEEVVLLTQIRDLLQK